MDTIKRGKAATRELIAIQMETREGDVEGNFAEAARLVAESSPQKDAIVALPELLNTGYDWDAISKLTAEDAKRQLEFLAGVAKAHGIYLLAGSIAEAVGDLRYNASYVFGPGGDILGRYAKCHLFSPFQEDVHFARGSESLCVSLGGVVCGVSICYDLRFPELYRRQVLDGATLFAIPSVWPARRGNVWRTLAIARAMEQQCTVLAVNRAGFDADGREYGGSLLVDPWGNVLAEAAGSETCIIRAEFDAAEVDKARMHIPSLCERRPEVYKLDWDISSDILANGGGDF